MKTESEDAELVQMALNMEACCALMMGDPNEVIGLLEGTSHKILLPNHCLHQPIECFGKSKEAKMILQVAMYQHMVILFRSVNGLSYAVQMTRNIMMRHSSVQVTLPKPFDF